MYQANKNRKTNKKEPKREQGDPLFADSGRASSEFPEWLQEFRENLVDDEIPLHGDSHASSSPEASLEPLFKIREDLGEHSVYTHVPKDRNCEICKRTKITRAPMQKTQWWSRTSCWKFWWLDNSRSQGPQWQLRISRQSPICSRGAGLGHSMDPSHIRAKQKLHRKLKEACKSFWCPIGNQKSLTLTIPWNSANPVKISPGIIARLHHTDQKQMGLLKEQCAE